MSAPAEPLKQGDALSPITREITFDNMVEFERVVWDRGRNSHSDEEAAKRDGMARPLASGQNQMAFIHEMMERNFGDGWAYGGRISVRYIHPVFAGDRITPHGVVTSVSEDGGKPRVNLDLWCENQDGQKTAAGTASAWQPSPLNSWIDHKQGIMA